jgi:hypothetical protein
MLVVVSADVEEASVASAETVISFTACSFSEWDFG